MGKELCTKFPLLRIAQEIDVRQVRLTLDVGYSVEIQNVDYTSNPTQSNVKPSSTTAENISTSGLSPE